MGNVEVRSRWTCANSAKWCSVLTGVACANVSGVLGRDGRSGCQSSLAQAAVMNDAAESCPEIQDVPSMILDLRQEILQMQKLLSGMDGTLSSHTASLDSLRCTVDSVFAGHARSKSKLSTGLDRCMESTSEGPEEQDPAFSSFAVNINTEVNERLDTLELVQAPKD
eukprot:s5126_g5.t1